MRSALVYRHFSVSKKLKEGTPSYIIKSFGTLHLRPLGGGSFSRFVYITLIFHWAQQPKEDLLEEIELFMTKVLPELEVPDYATAAE